MKTYRILAVIACILLAWMAWSLHRIAKSSGTIYIDGGEVYLKN